MKMENYIGALIQTSHYKEVRYSGYAGNPYMFVPVGAFLRVINYDTINLLCDFYVEGQWTPEYTYNPITQTHDRTGQWLTRHSAWINSTTIADVFHDGLRFLTMIPLCQSWREASEPIKELPPINIKDLFMRRQGPYSWEMKRKW